MVGVTTGPASPLKMSRPAASMACHTTAAPTTTTRHHSTAASTTRLVTLKGPKRVGGSAATPLS